MWEVWQVGHLALHWIAQSWLGWCWNGKNVKPCWSSKVDADIPRNNPHHNSPIWLKISQIYGEVVGCAQVMFTVCAGVKFQPFKCCYWWRGGRWRAVRDFELSMWTIVCFYCFTLEKENWENTTGQRKKGPIVETVRFFVQDGIEKNNGEWG